MNLKKNMKETSHFKIKKPVRKKNFHKLEIASILILGNINYLNHIGKHEGIVILEEIKI